jgi:hypothetical protein
MEPLNILNSLQIASPCPASWEAMKGDDRVRFCDSCSKHVYNVSDLTADEALRVIQENEGTPCMRLHKRRDGTILTADCPVGLRSRIRRRMVRTLTAVVLLSVSIPSAVWAYAKGTRPGAIPPPPTGPGVTLSDWSDWALVVVGLRSRVTYSGWISPGGIWISPGEFIPILDPIPGEFSECPVDPTVEPEEAGDL